MKSVFNVLGLSAIEAPRGNVVKWICSLEERSREERDLCEFSLSQGALDTGCG